MELKVVKGGCLGNNGQNIVVCLGFIPQWLRVTVDAANPLHLEWNREMALYSNSNPGGILSNNSTDSDLAAADGITPYSGGDWIVYDGVTDNRWEVSDSGIVLPAGTLAVGAAVAGYFFNGGHIKNASTDADEEELPASMGFTSPFNGQKIKTPPGFIIGADTNLNPNGARISWLAFGE